MDFSLSDEQQLLVRTVRRFIAEELVPLERDVERDGELSPEIAKLIHEKAKSLGLYAINMPEALGGGGLSTFDWMLVEEEFGRTTDILIRRAFGNVYHILLEGTPAQQARWLLPSIRGERTFSVAFTEPEAGSDAAAVRTTAVRDGDDWVLNGYKHYISDAQFSDFFIVTASTDRSAGARGITTFIVDKNTAGVTVGDNQPMMGLRGTSHCPLTFDNVRLSDEHRLGAEGQGLKLALKTLGTVRLAQVGARAIGKSTMILEKCLAQVEERKQFGQPLADFQLIQSSLADSACEINAARLLLLHTAWKIDQGQDARADIAMVKLMASETLGRVADRAVQIFGGCGFSKELAIEQYYRDARVYRIFDGTSEIQRLQIARALRRSPEDSLRLVA